MVLFLGFLLFLVSEGLLFVSFFWASFHFHFVLSLGAVIAIFSGTVTFGEKIIGSKNLLPSSSSTLSLYHPILIFFGIL